MNKDEIITAEAAEILGISERTLIRDRLKDKPCYPFYRKGRLVRYSRKKLQIYNENLKNSLTFLKNTPHHRFLLDKDLHAGQGGGGL